MIAVLIAVTVIVTATTWFAMRGIRADIDAENDRPEP